MNCSSRASIFSYLRTPGATVLALLVALTFGSFAAANTAPEAQPEPAVVVETLTTKLLDLARSGQETLKKDPEAFYTEIESVLEPMVSFDFIARNVMGNTYWKQATEKQREQFLHVFKRSLVETYVKGMSQSMNYNIEILKDQTQVMKNTATIVQKITGPETTNHVVYSLGQGKSGQWKVLNLVLDGVNLGKTFRSQFAQGVKDNNGDLQAAISNWGSKS